MGQKFLMKGNEAIAEAAIRNGCIHFFGYPITPQTEVSRLYGESTAENRRHLFTGGELKLRRSIWCMGAASCGRARYDLLLLARASA